MTINCVYNITGPLGILKMNRNVIILHKDEAVPEKIGNLEDDSFIVI